MISEPAYTTVFSTQLITVRKNSFVSDAVGIPEHHMTILRILSNSSFII